MIDSISPRSTSSVGVAIEYQAIVGLLDRGHRVAVPVVDDDGVDLIVNYRLTVQVKSAARRPNGAKSSHGWRFEFRCGKRDAARNATSSERGQRLEHVDFFLFFARDEGVWWVVPRSAMPPIVKRFRITPGAPSDAQWRDAWHLLGTPEVQAVAA